jgi:choline transport protein
MIADPKKGATHGFVTANFILGMANLSNPSYVIQRWHTVMVSWVAIILAAAINIFLPRLMNKLSTAALCWNVLTFGVVIITILTTNDHKQSSSFVFKVSISPQSFAGLSKRLS